MERELPLRLEDRREVVAMGFVVRRGHRQHACVDAETQARTIARARGLRRPNIDYLANTAAQLRDLGINDPEIDALLAQTRALGA
jgi:cation transport protein ChaC